MFGFGKHIDGDFSHSKRSLEIENCDGKRCKKREGL